MTKVEVALDELVDPLPTILVPMIQLRVRLALQQHEVLEELPTPEGEVVAVHGIVSFLADQAVVGDVLVVREEAGDPLIELLMLVSSIAIAVRATKTRRTSIGSLLNAVFFEGMFRTMLTRSGWQVSV